MRSFFLAAGFAWLLLLAAGRDAGARLCVSPDNDDLDATGKIADRVGKRLQGQQTKRNYSVRVAQNEKPEKQYTILIDGEPFTGTMDQCLAKLWESECKKGEAATRKNPQ